MEPVLVSIAAGVQRITLNRPEKLNAFNPAMHKALAAAMDRAETSSPFSRSVEMSPFWQNAQRMLHEVKKIVPEPCVPRYTSSSPRW